MTTRDVYRALLAAGWQIDAQGALTNTPPGKAWCTWCGWVDEAEAREHSRLCRNCYNHDQRVAYHIHRS